MKKIGVMVVDDSAIVRQVFTELIESDPALELIDTAMDPIFAQAKMEKRWPDVIILDIEMPRMDGLTFMKKIMNERPTPIIICSTLTEKGAKVTMEALSSGALDVITKPGVGVKGFLNESSRSILTSIRAAGKTNVKRIGQSSIKVHKKLTADAILPAGSKKNLKHSQNIIAMGASTGGTQALELILKQLPVETPGIVVVQHMPEKFTTAFANRLNTISEIEVREAENGDPVRPGLALIAPGNYHMLLHWKLDHYSVEIKSGPQVNHHRPSVDVLFRSVASSAGQSAVGVILTGMGDDGASGMLEMHQAGAWTIAQDEESCIVYGMPAEAVKKGGVRESVSLEKIASRVLEKPLNR